MKIQINFTQLPKPEFFARKTQMNAHLKSKIVPTPISKPGLGKIKNNLQHDKTVQNIHKRRTETFSRYLATRRFM